MANSKQAIKRVRQANKHRLHNRMQKSEMRTLIKKNLQEIESGNQEAARETFKAVCSSVDKLARKGIIHKNKAARHKQRINAKIKAMAQ